ncbi:hypothetical protein ACQUFY_22285 [Robbsia andropogonis]|uniref:hypothetical protein n=1 Tax=Robbsia andropogonis TaxID=28092 RepID=UPI003D1935EC
MNIDKVIVVDWDNCIYDAYGTHHAQLHHAISKVARDKSEEIPPLLSASLALEQGCVSYSTHDEHAPLLAMNHDAFRHYCSTHASASKKSVVEDFLSCTLPKTTLHEKANLTKAILNQRDDDARAWLKQPCNQLLESTPSTTAHAMLCGGALTFLEKQRTPCNRIILISNTEQEQLDDEVRQMGVTGFFDVVSGLQCAPGRRSESDAKPDPTRLLDSLSRLSISSAVPITAYGDKEHDILQCAVLAERGRHVEGVLIAPADPRLGTTIRLAGIPTRVVADIDGQ